MIRIFSCLQRHPSSGVLYFRRSVPARLRPILGRAEIKRSLNTCEKRVAIPLAMRLNIEVDELFLRLETGGMGKPKGRKAKPKDDGGISKIVFDELVLPTGAKAKGVVIDTGDDAKDAAIAGQLLGGITTTPPAATPGQVIESAKLDVVAKKFRAEKMKGGTWREKTAADHEAVHALLVQVLGNVDISTIGHPQARQFKEVLLQLPANMTKGVFAGKSVRQLLRMGVPDAARMHPKTVNMKLSLTSSLFLWATRHGYCALNPFEGLKLRISSRASEERAAFDVDDLRKLFDPVRFSPEKLRKPFQYWCTLLALYTGGRAQEIAQLRVQDVFEAEPGLWAIRIAKDAGQLKTASSEREIPLHPAIIQRGFLAYVERVKAAGHEKLFPEAWDTENGPGDKFSRWFSVYRKNLKIGSLRKGDGLPVKCLHSFRHNFADGLKQAGADPLKTKQLTGHKDADITTARYGKAFPLSALYETVCMLSFDLPEVGHD